MDRPGLISKFYKALKAGSILNISKKVDSSQADKNRSHRFRVGVGIGHSALIKSRIKSSRKDIGRQKRALLGNSALIQITSMVKLSR